MTVIAMAVGREGAALAAEGRVWRKDSGEPVTDIQQKIFPFGRAGAYALTGWVIGKNYNLVTTARRAAAQISPSLDLTGTLDAFAKAINYDLAAACRDGMIFTENEDQTDPVKRTTIARVWVAFQSARGARLAILRFLHRERQVVDDVPIEIRELKPGQMYLTGSDIVAKSLFGERKPLNPGSSLEDAVKCITQYVEMCASPTGEQLDPWCRVHAGGHVHVAVLSAGEFHWIRPPASAAE